MVETLGHFADSLLPTLCIITGTLLLQFLSFSRTKEFPPFWVLTAGAVYFTLGRLYWSYLLKTSIWFGGERIFHWSNYPTIPAITVYFGMFWIALTLVFTLIVWAHKTTYTVRQKIGYTLASALSIYGLYSTLIIPIEVQTWVDAISLSITK